MRTRNCCASREAEMAETAHDTVVDEAASRTRWQSAVRREAWRWSNPDPCPACGEWVGHFGGSNTRDPCNLIPMNVPLEELRPNCYAVRRLWIGDAIRAALKNAGA